jgi:hypothetical protein
MVARLIEENDQQAQLLPHLKVDHAVEIFIVV